MEKDAPGLARAVKLAGTIPCCPLLGRLLLLCCLFHEALDMSGRDRVCIRHQFVEPVIGDLGDLDQSRGEI